MNSYFSRYFRVELQLAGRNSPLFNPDALSVRDATNELLDWAVIEYPSNAVIGLVVWEITSVGMDIRVRRLSPGEVDAFWA